MREARRTEKRRLRKKSRLKQKGRKELSQRDRIRGRVTQARKERVDGTRTVRWEKERGWPPSRLFSIRFLSYLVFHYRSSLNVVVNHTEPKTKHTEPSPSEPWTHSLDCKECKQTWTSLPRDGLTSLEERRHKGGTRCVNGPLWAMKEIFFWA